MSLRDYEGWRRYSKHKREAREAYERGLKNQQMSDREIMNAKHGYKSYKTIQVKNIEQMPDQKWHRRISFIKSGIRIIGYGFIPFSLITATALLVVSEVVGIIEELV
ncbi:hypothetical protein N8580_00155 [Akkermansiaceae bacterium]|nr:hypothetical protein [Akkermansiaceae bacterium]